MSNQLSQQLGNEHTSLVKGIWVGSQCHLLCSDNHADDNFHGADDGDGNARSGSCGRGAAFNKWQGPKIPKSLFLQSLSLSFMLCISTVVPGRKTTQNFVLSRLVNENMTEKVEMHSFHQ